MQEEMKYDGILLFCSDPDPEKANLWKDIKRCLIPENERWVAIGILGAPVILANPIFLPIDFACIVGQIEFAQAHKRFRNGRKNTFMIVSHDCGYYARITAITSQTFTIDNKMADVPKGADILKERFQGAVVKGYFKIPGQPGFQEIP